MITVRSALCGIILFLSTSAQAQQMTLHLSGLMPFGVGVGYQSRTIDTGTPRISGQLGLSGGLSGDVAAPLLAGEVQVDYLKSFAVGSHAYWGAGLGAWSVFGLGIAGEAQAFVGTRTLGSSVGLFAEGGAKMVAGLREAFESSQFINVIPYIRVGARFGAGR